MTRKNKTKNPSPVVQTQQESAVAAVARPSTKPVPIPTRKAKKRTPAREGNVDAIVEAVCAITDPFCPGAEGSKWPDANSAKSLAITIRGAISLISDAEGETAAIINPAWPGGFAITSAGGGSMAGSTATFSTNMVAFAGTSSYAPTAYRLVSGGIQVFNIGAMTASSGYLAVAQVNGGTAVNLTTFDFANYGQETIQTCAFASVIGSPVCQTFKPAGAQAHMFAEINTLGVSASQTSNDFSFIAVGIVGGEASKTIGRIEYVLHFELLFGRSDALNLLATAPARPMPMLVNASTAVTTFVNDLAMEGAKAVGQEVKKHAKKYIVKTVGGLIGARLGGPSGAVAGWAIGDIPEID